MAEAEGKKKVRSANFSQQEVELLTDLIVKFASIIECKKSDSLSWKEKLKAWENLTSEFNARSNGLPRTMVSLKTKYETLKKELRKKVAMNKQELYKTGGGVADSVPLTPVEKKIYTIIYLSTEGLLSRYDDDDAYEDVCDVEDKMRNKNTQRRVQEIQVHKGENEDETIYLEVIEDSFCHQFYDTETQLTLMDRIPSYTPENCATSSQSHQEQVQEGNLHSQNKENVTPTTRQTQSGVKRPCQKWNPDILKKPMSSELNAKRRKNLLTKLQAAEKIKTLTESKNTLIQLQAEYFRNEIDFKNKENDLKIQKAEEDIKNAKVEGEFKQIEKRIKEETLKKIVQGPAYNK